MEGWVLGLGVGPRLGETTDVPTPRPVREGPVGPHSPSQLLFTDD